jgi:hypothetical protein
MGKGKQGRNPEQHILLDQYKAAAANLFIHLTTIRLVLPDGIGKLC